MSRYYDSEDVLWFSPGDMSSDGINLLEPRKISKSFIDESSIKLYPANAVLMVGIGATVGKIGLSERPCYTNQQINTIIFNEAKVLSKFGAYFLLNKSSEINKKTPIVTLQIFNQSKVKQVLIDYPSLSEQHRIVDYLDEKLSKIDNRVSVLEQQQDTYTRLKKSIIQQAVTRGLNPDVRLKDSGIEWIGMIPEHWNAMRIKDVVTLVKDKTTDTSGPYIALENIESWNGKYIETEAETEGTNSIFKSGDVLFGKLRPYLAKGYIPSYDGICSSEFFVMRANKICYSRYLLYYILSKSVIDYIKNKVAGVKMPRTNWFEFGGLPIFLPPLSEQHAIAAYLDEKCAKIDAAIENISKQIEASKRLKRAIINEAISGKTTI
jgi:restriction endonuclease S subunit